MGDRIDIDFDQLPDDLKQLAKASEQAAIARIGDEIALLGLLRLLEELHSQIRDAWFQDSLPTNRQRLYALLRDIEISGGWPYIQRMRLHALLEQLELAEAEISDDMDDAEGNFSATE
ncbi:hypothetical protein [Leptolyngbya iicbica]|uniref:Uncharacterized protein n=2 Tax=Cyanophyceae TaxID=3028117 RepID=A0A4Q7EIF9_9CYAN|nr:hypothetical protein [Leptolyngbya sp. LK]RZM82848.1 hypothetical protein DYY88_06505 [Leptolyngbya sp. LK]